MEISRTLNDLLDEKVFNRTLKKPQLVQDQKPVYETQRKPYRSQTRSA